MKNPSFWVVLGCLALVGLGSEADRRWLQPDRVARHEAVLEAYRKLSEQGRQVVEKRDEAHDYEKKLRALHAVYAHPVSRDFVWPLSRVGSLGAPEEPWMATAVQMPNDWNMHPLDVEMRHAWCEGFVSATVEANRGAREYNKFVSDRWVLIKDYMEAQTEKSHVVLSGLDGMPLDPLPDLFTESPYPAINCVARW